MKLTKMTDLVDAKIRNACEANLSGRPRLVCRPGNHLRIVYIKLLL